MYIRSIYTKYIRIKGKGWTGVGTALGWNGMIYLFFLGGGDLRGDLLRGRSFKSLPGKTLIFEIRKKRLDK